MTDHFSENVTLRSANIDDSQTLLDWRNDSETRRASHNLNKVTLDDHVTWLSKVLNSTNRKLLIAEKGGAPVGTVRADFGEGSWELSWTVAPDSKGQGVAKQMVLLLANTISEPIRAEIKSGNIASRRVAEFSGMVFDKEVAGVGFYSRV